MTISLQVLAEHVRQLLGDALTGVNETHGELTLEVGAGDIVRVCRLLRDDPRCRFEQLIDLCGVDYSEYGAGSWTGARFAVVYHLLSIANNQRLRLRAFVADDMPLIDSVLDVWASANWYEREAFDLFGIVFSGHPDLRRILTDYGFIGHPFRKDFPLIGHVEMRYDPEKQRVVYQPVSIEPRVNTPRVIRAAGEAPVAGNEGQG